jgi:hypothetical protein
MYSIANLNTKERSELFSETAAQKGMTTSVVEKDFSNGKKETHLMLKL